MNLAKHLRVSKWCSLNDSWLVLWNMFDFVIGNNPPGVGIPPTRQQWSSTVFFLVAQTQHCCDCWVRQKGAGPPAPEVALMETSSSGPDHSGVSAGYSFPWRKKKVISRWMNFCWCLCGFVQRCVSIDSLSSFFFGISLCLSMGVSTVIYSVIVWSSSLPSFGGLGGYLWKSPEETALEFCFKRNDVNPLKSSLFLDEMCLLLQIPEFVGRNPGRPSFLWLNPLDFADERSFRRRWVA